MWVFGGGGVWRAGGPGILEIEAGDDGIMITDFILSCRVMGRKVEETMLSIAVTHARSLGLPRVVARYLPTERNRPCLQFFAQSGFRREDSETFVWPTAEDYPTPDCIQVERRS